MRSQLLVEHTIYVLLYLFMIFGFVAIVNNLEKTYVSILNSKDTISYFYTKEKLLDILPESEIAQIKLYYPLQSSLKHPYSTIIKNGSTIIILSR